MKTKFCLLSISILIHFSLLAQRSIPSTDTLTVTGEIRKPIRIHVTDIDTFAKIVIPDQIIFNHKGEIKDTLTGLKGVLLKNILASIEYIYVKPRELNEFYLVLTASDGYRVVFSWNEIYNTTAGEHFFILTEAEGNKLPQMEQRIAFISTGDLQSGRRYIKGLKHIDIRRLE